MITGLQSVIIFGINPRRDWKSAKEQYLLNDVMFILMPIALSH